MVIAAAQHAESFISDTLMAGILGGIVLMILALWLVKPGTIKRKRYRDEGRF